MSHNMGNGRCTEYTVVYTGCIAVLCNEGSLTWFKGLSRLSAIVINPVKLRLK